MLCRGINAGDELRRTLSDLLELTPMVQSIAAVSYTHLKNGVMLAILFIIYHSGHAVQERMCAGGAKQKETGKIGRAHV